MSTISVQIKEIRNMANVLEEEKRYAAKELMLQAADTIESLSVKQEKQKWIPCSDRLPKEPSPIPLTTEEVERMVEDGILQECIVTMYGAKKSTTLFYAGNGEWYDPVTEEFYDVIAWQSLSEPYKPNNQAAVQEGGIET